MSADTFGHSQDLHERPAELLQALLRFDTTNPPGDERECVLFIERLLDAAGFETTLVARDPERPNLVARLAGEGSAEPLLLYGHVDVVSVAGQKWSQPPFEGRIADGFVWGRGALDMKGGLAMLLAAVLRARALGTGVAGDLIFVALSDEEAGGDLGARHLVEERPELLDGVRYAIGEFGGFSLEVAGQRFYPIQVAEKQVCWLRATVRGPGGHGSLPMRGGTMARMAAMLRTLDRKRLPVHVTGPARRMIEAVAAELGLPRGPILRQVLNPALTDRILDLLGERGRIFDPLLHNTVNVTKVRAGEKLNVIPAEAGLELDGRLLPGFGPEDLLGELGALIGAEIELEVERFEPGPPEPDMGMFGLLGEVLRESDPGARPVPMLLPGITDARTIARLGIQTYGFLPMPLPAEMRFPELIHAADERIPVDALEFGTTAIHRLLARYGR